MMHVLLIRILLDIRMILYGVAVWSLWIIIRGIDSGTDAFYDYLKIFAFPLGYPIHAILAHFSWSVSVHIGICFIYFSVGCWQWFVLVPYLIRVLHPRLRLKRKLLV